MQKKPLTARRAAALEKKEAKAKRIHLIKISIPILLVVALLTTFFIYLPTIIEEYENDGLVRLSRVEGTDDEYYMDIENYIVFRPAPTYFEPASLYKTDDEYDKYGYSPRDGKDPLYFYKVGNADTTEYLSGEYVGTGTTLYVSTEITLPTLSSMNANLIRVCISDVGNPREISSIESQEIINQTISAYVDGENIETIPFDSYEWKVDLKFYSESDWPMLYYNLTYLHCPDNNYIFDRCTHRCVAVGDLLSSLINYS